MLRSFFRTLSVQLVLVFVVSIVGVSAQVPEGASDPNPFVGTWVIDTARSTYEGTSPRTMSVRTLDVHADGRWLETHRNTRIRDGETWEGWYHWVGNIDGIEFPEFGRPGGPFPGNRLTIIEVNSHLWNVTFRNYRTGEARIVLTDTWAVSADGQTLTIDRRGTSAQGQPTHSVEVYNNDGFAARRTGR